MNNDLLVFALVTRSCVFGLSSFGTFVFGIAIWLHIQRTGTNGLTRAMMRTVFALGVARLATMLVAGAAGISAFIPHPLETLIILTAFSLVAEAGFIWEAYRMIKKAIQKEEPA